MRAHRLFTGRATRSQGALRCLIPLLDTLFLLLFTLLATSEPRKEDALDAIRIRLPEVAEGESAAAAEARNLVFEIDARSEVRLLGHDPILGSPQELQAALQARLQERLPEEYAIEIRGDHAADHGVAVQLLQQLRQAGFRSIDLIATGDPGFEAFGVDPSAGGSR